MDADYDTRTDFFYKGGTRVADRVDRQKDLTTEAETKKKSSTTKNEAETIVGSGALHHVHPAVHGIKTIISDENKITTS